MKVFLVRRLSAFAASLQQVEAALVKTGIFKCGYTKSN